MSATNSHPALTGAKHSVDVDGLEPHARQVVDAESTTDRGISLG